MKRDARHLMLGVLAATLVVAGTFGGQPKSVSAVVGVVALNTPYSQDFAGLATSGTSNPWANDTTINGWYSTEPTYRASDGSDATGGFYSFGTAGDRAIGAIPSGATPAINYGVRMRNNTGGNIQYFYVAYVGEQWRRSGAGAEQFLDFGYQIGVPVDDITKGSWTGVAALNFVSPTIAGAAGPLDGNSPANRLQLSAYITLSVPLIPNEEIMFRWRDANDRGADHGLAIDDVVIIPYVFSPTAVNWALSSLQVNQTSAQAGDQLTYQLVIADAEGGDFALTDTFDSRLAIVRAPGMAINGQTVTAGGLVAPGERRVFTVTVRVVPGISGAIENSATVEGGGSARTLEAPTVVIASAARR